jgi:hypothetical protein
VKHLTAPFNLHASVVNIKMIVSHNPRYALIPPPVLVPGCGAYALYVDRALIIVGPPALKRALILITIPPSSAAVGCAGATFD